MLYPLPDVHRQADDNIQDRMRSLRRDKRQSYRASYRRTMDTLRRDGQVAPFKVWRSGDRLILCDGRHYEYSAARRLGLPITTIDVGDCNRDQAEANVIVATLHNSGRPQLCDYYRVVLALRCAATVAYTKQAKAQQKRKPKTDLPNLAKQSLNTRLWVASLSGVSGGQVQKVQRLLKDGPRTFSPARWSDVMYSLEIGDMSINAGYVKLRDCEQRDEKVFKNALKRGEKPQDIRQFADRPLALKKLSERLKRAKAAAKAVTPAMKRKLGWPDFADGFRSCILHADFRNALQRLLDELGPLEPDLIFGSPPYPVDLTYQNGANYKMTPDKWVAEFVEPIARLAAAHAKVGTRLALQFSDVFEPDDSGYRTSLHYSLLSDAIAAIRSLNLGWRYRETKTWLKFMHMKRAPVGAYGTPLDPRNYLNQEHLVVFCFESFELQPPRGIESDMSSDEFRQWSPSAWYLAPVSSAKNGHPAPFPETLAERAVKLFSWPTGLVIDPWVGTGTTTAVCAKNNRRWIGIDTNLKTCRDAYVRTMEGMNEFQRRLKAIKHDVQDRNSRKVELE